MPIIINSDLYQVEVASLSRQIEISEKYREMTEDAVYHREIQGVYHHYTLELGNIEAKEYDRLIDTLSSCDEYLTVTLPSEQSEAKTFRAMVENISDGIITEGEDGYYWDNLTVTFTAKEPR